MRYIKLASIITFLIILSCCRKPTEETALVLSQTEVSDGEPLIAKVVHAPAGARFIWQITDGAQMKQFSSDSSMVKLTLSHLFRNPYKICVKVVTGPDSTDATTYCSEIKVREERFEPPASLPETSVRSLAGDQLTLKPVLYSADSSLDFIVQTKNSYSCLNSYILYNNASVKNSKIVTSFKGVWLRDACEPLNIPAVSFCQTHAYFKDGIYPVEITFNSIVYKGELTVSSYQQYYEFHWPYTEGVVIEPKVIDGHY
jgi:hypothetical protein